MTFTFIISSKLEKVLDKIARKDKVLSVAVRKKIEQIISCDGMLPIFQFTIDADSVVHEDV